MSLATLTKTGRAAIVKAIAARDIFLAWGTGEEAWDADDAVLPSLVDITAITGEVGRRRALRDAGRCGGDRHPDRVGV